MKSKNLFETIDNNLEKLEQPSEFFNELKGSDEFNSSNFKILGELVNIEQELKYHPEGNVWNHICMVVNYASIAKDLANNKREFMWGALLHDLGKITTTVKRKGRWTSYNHDTVGANMVKEILTKETDDKQFIEKVCEIVKFHMHHIYILKNLPFGNTKELMKSNNINDILLIFACDKLGRGDQNNEDKNRIFNEVLIILDILEKGSGHKFNEARENIIKFKNKIVNNLN